MFKSLKEKLSGWFKGTEEEPKEKAEKAKTEKKSDKSEKVKVARKAAEKPAKKEKAEKKNNAEKIIEKEKNEQESSEKPSTEKKTNPLSPETKAMLGMTLPSHRKQEKITEERKEAIGDKQKGEEKKEGFFGKIKKVFSEEEKQEAKPEKEEFGFGIVSKEEFDNYTKRVFLLNKKEIDRLFALCGWKEDGCEKDGNESLPEHRLDYIKNSLENAGEWVDNLLFDAPYGADVKEVKKLLDKNLRVIEKARVVVNTEFERERKKAEERAEELREEIEEAEVEKAEEEPEALEKAEVVEEIEEKKGFFGKLARKLTASELSADDFDEMFEELELALLENNVALDVVDKIREELKSKLVGKSFTSKEVEGKILGALKEAIDSVLIEPDNLMDRIKKAEKPFVILFFGINGSGKTTSIAKLAWKLKKEGLNVVVAAGDTFRAASIEQLETHASRIGVDIVKGEYGKDPASVAFDAIAYGKKNKKDVVLIDTAGRMYTRSNLMKEMEKIVKVSKPDLKIFVGESITGNDGTEQAKMFHETAGIDGIILSKADIDEKAGTILSVSYVTGKPIYFLGVGQEYDDLEEFKKENVLKHLGLD